MRGRKKQKVDEEEEEEDGEDGGKMEFTPTLSRSLGHRSALVILLLCFIFACPGTSDDIPGLSPLVSSQSVEPHARPSRRSPFLCPTTVRLSDPAGAGGVSVDLLRQLSPAFAHSLNELHQRPPRLSLARIGALKFPLGSRVSFVAMRVLW